MIEAILYERTVALCASMRQWTTLWAAA